MAQPSNRHTIHIKRQFLPIIGQSSGLEDQNRLEATSHQKLATDGASPEFTHSHWMPIILPPRAGPSHTSWPNSPPEHAAQGGGGGASINKEIARKPTEIGR